MDLLKSALAYFEQGQPVIAVGRNKRPYRDGWADYFTRPQTEKEVKEQFSNGAHGIARVLYPACNYIHLDFDGEHSEKAWSMTGIVLPETARFRTQSGSFHLVFTASQFLKNAKGLKRAVRIVESDCGCHCGVDFLMHGYAIVPPSPGYRKIVPLERAVPIPDDVVRLVMEKRKGSPELTGVIPQGKRDVTLLRIGGRYRRQGMGYHELVEKLSEVNQSRCRPSLEHAAIEKIAK